VIEVGDPGELDRGGVGVGPGLDRHLVLTEVTAQGLAQADDGRLEPGGLVVERDVGVGELEALEAQRHRLARLGGLRLGGVGAGDVPVGRGVVQRLEREPRMVELDGPDHDRRRAAEAGADGAGEIDHDPEARNRGQGVALELPDPDDREVVERERQVGKVMKEAEAGRAPVHLGQQGAVELGLHPVGDLPGEKHRDQNQKEDEQREGGCDADQDPARRSTHEMTSRWWNTAER
jgi:hypothetical protein